MTARREDADRFSLKRWSQRKIESSAKATPVPAPRTPNEIAGTAPSAAVTGPPAATPPVELPAIESLTFESDFTAFLKPEVDPTLKRAALKQLFRDPRFNVMDGLDTYIDDYTKPDPIPPDMLAELVKRFDFTPTPPAADAAEKASPESRAGEIAPAAGRSAPERTEDGHAPTPAGAISDASSQPAVEPTVTVPSGTARDSGAARESTVARDPSTSSGFDQRGTVPSTGSGQAERR